MIASELALELFLVIAERSDRSSVIGWDGSSGIHKVWRPHGMTLAAC